MKVYVFINMRAGKSRAVVDKMRQSQTWRAWSRAGGSDTFALVEIKNQLELAHTVLAKIQSIDEVDSTDIQPPFL